MTDRFFEWMKYEPVIGLMMIIGAVVLFIGAYRRDGNFNPTTFWQWFSRIIEAMSIAIMFLGLLWAFRAILNDNQSTFAKRHGRISEDNYNSLKTIWGSPHVQKELVVAHFMTRTVNEEVPREESDKPPMYRKTTERQLVEMNSIAGTKGEAFLKLNTRKKGSAFYNGFDSKFNINYDIVNEYDTANATEFTFPLAEQVIYDSLRIMEDGKDISKDIHISEHNIRWSRTMAPRQKMSIAIGYVTRGVEYFYYQVPEPREINNFTFKLTIDKLPVAKINYPEDCLTPNEINATPDGNGTVLTWHFNNSITTAGMGVELEKPAQPGAKIMLVLHNSPLTLMMLVVSICLTLLILGFRVDFLEISLLSAVYCVLFIIMASVSDYALGFWGSLVIGNLITLYLSWLLFRKYESKSARRIIMSLVIFFTLIYPLSGLFPDFEANFKGLVTVALIVFIFLISIYSRMKKVQE